MSDDRRSAPEDGYRERMIALVERLLKYQRGPAKELFWPPAGALEVACNPVVEDVVREFLKDRDAWAEDAIQSAGRVKYRDILFPNRFAQGRDDALLKLAWLVAHRWPEDNPLKEAILRRARDLGIGKHILALPEDPAFRILLMLLDAAQKMASHWESPHMVFPPKIGAEWAGREARRWFGLVFDDQANGVAGKKPPEETEPEPAFGGNGVADPDLDATDAKIICVMYSTFGATSRHRSVKSEKIAEEIDPNWTRDSISKRLSHLRKRDFIFGQRGNGGGTWLTDKGIEKAIALEKH